jgi:predicted nucleotidyltransferase
MLRERIVMKAVDDILPRAAAFILSNYKRSVELALPDVEKLILFGSRARGQARSDSDYDVAVVVRNLSASDASVVSSRTWPTTTSSAASSSARSR